MKALELPPKARIRKDNLERARINAINTVVFNKPAVAKVCNAGQPNGYTPPVWNVRPGAEDFLAYKSLSSQVIGETA